MTRVTAPHFGNVAGLYICKYLAGNLYHTKQFKTIKKINISGFIPVYTINGIAMYDQMVPVHLSNRISRHMTV